MFTDKLGLVKKKSQVNATKDMVLGKFLPLVADREVVAHKIMGNSFIPVYKYNGDISVFDDLGLETALQISRPVLGEGNSRIFVEFKLDEGRPVIKYCKKYHSDGHDIIINLSAQNLTEALKIIGEQVINTLERNTFVRISTITLMFMQDTDRKVWFMGSSECLVYEKAGGRSISPLTHLDQIKPANLDISSALSRAQTNSKSTRNRSFLISKKCAGDFCCYILQKNEKSLGKTNADVEDFISKITLAFFSDSNGQESKYKQELGSNYIEKEHEKLRLIQFTNSIPYKYILIGKSIMAGKCKSEIIEFTPEEVKAAEEPEFRQGDKPPNPLAHPSRMYDEAKVCERCYEVYNLIRSLKTKPTSVKALPRINRDIPRYFKINTDAISEAVDEQDSQLLSREAKSQYSLLYKLTVAEKSNTIDVNNKVLDEITSKIFPNDFANSWGIKTQEQKNTESWKKYIASLKQKSVLRNRLKTLNN